MGAHGCGAVADGGRAGTARACSVAVDDALRAMSMGAPTSARDASKNAPIKNLMFLPSSPRGPTGPLDPLHEAAGRAPAAVFDTLHPGRVEAASMPSPPAASPRSDLVRAEACGRSIDQYDRSIAIF